MRAVGSAFPVLKATYAELNLRPDDVSGRLLLAGARFFLASVMTFIVVRFGMKSEMTISKKWVLPLIFWGFFRLASSTSSSTAASLT